MFYPEETHISFDNVSSKRKSVGDRTGERLWDTIRYECLWGFCLLR
jgi:hypothetical protein